VHLLDQIDRWGRLTPQRAAHVSGGRVLTYGQLCAASSQLAARLATYSGDKAGPVVVHGHKEPELLIAFLGAVKSGRPYVPVDTSIPAQRVEQIVQGCGGELVLTPERITRLLSEAQGPPPPRRVEGKDPFYILFTSGSTGEPKGVVVTLANLSAFVDWMRAEHSVLESRETFLNQAPFSFDLSVMDLFLSLATGGTLFSVTRDEIANLPKLYRALGNSGVTTWVSTPSFAQMCLVERTFNASMLPAARRFLFCGETLPRETAAQLLDRFPQAEIWNTYGPTETTVATTSIRIDRRILAQYSPLPIGWAMPGARISVVDSELRPVGDGERGEIVIAGPHVSAGYINRDDLTAKAFFQFEGMRTYRTGDSGHTRDGMLFFDGRIDDQIKLFGYRIELGDLEANLRALPEITDAVVIPVKKNDRVDSLAAFVVLVNKPAGSDFEISARLKKQLGERLPVYMLPRRFHFLDALPVTANGKIDRRRLAETL
jgi:D-alanine--poly(phosphoribitol) ligase subunit 1